MAHVPPNFPLPMRHSPPDGHRRDRLPFFEFPRRRHDAITTTASRATAAALTVAATTSAMDPQGRDADPPPPAAEPAPTFVAFCAWLQTELDQLSSLLLQRTRNTAVSDEEEETEGWFAAWTQAADRASLEEASMELHHTVADAAAAVAALAQACRPWVVQAAAAEERREIVNPPPPPARTSSQLPLFEMHIGRPPPSSSKDMPWLRSANSSGLLSASRPSLIAATSDTEAGNSQRVASQSTHSDTQRVSSHGSATATTATFVVTPPKSPREETYASPRAAPSQPYENATNLKLVPRPPDKGHHPNRSNQSTDNLSTVTRPPVDAFHHQNTKLQTVAEPTLQTIGVPADHDAEAAAGIAYDVRPRDIGPTSPSVPCGPPRTVSPRQRRLEGFTSDARGPRAAQGRDHDGTIHHRFVNDNGRPVATITHCSSSHGVDDTRPSADSETIASVLPQTLLASSVGPAIGSDPSSARLAHLSTHEINGAPQALTTRREEQLERHATQPAAAASRGREEPIGEWRDDRRDSSAGDDDGGERLSGAAAGAPSAMRRRGSHARSRITRQTAARGHETDETETKPHNPAGDDDGPVEPSPSQLVSIDDEENPVASRSTVFKAQGNSASSTSMYAAAAAWADDTRTTGTADACTSKESNGATDGAATAGTTIDDVQRGAILFRALQRTNADDALYVTRASPPSVATAAVPVATTRDDAAEVTSPVRFRRPSNNDALRRFFASNAVDVANSGRTIHVANALFAPLPPAPPLSGSIGAVAVAALPSSTDDDRGAAVVPHNPLPRMTTRSSIIDITAVAAVSRGRRESEPSSLQPSRVAVPASLLPHVLVYNTRPAQVEDLTTRGDAHSTAQLYDEEQLYEAESASDFERVGPWVIVDCLGRGQQGEVHLAVHENTGECVAVKKLRTDVYTSFRGRAEREQLNRELSLSLSFDHPNIVKALELIKPRQAETIFLVMQLAPGGSLAKVADDGACKTFPLPMLRKVASQATSALRYLHSMKVVHRDIKPDNFLLDTDGNVLLSDFGVCVVNSPAFVAKSTSDPIDGFAGQGALSYRAPEEFIEASRAAGPHVDMWSLGVSLYAMTFGVLPFRAETYDALRAAILNSEPSYEFTPAALVVQGRTVPIATDISGPGGGDRASMGAGLRWWVESVLQPLLKKDRRRRIRSRALWRVLQQQDHQ